MSKHTNRRLKIERYKKKSHFLGDIVYLGDYNTPTSSELYQFNSQSISIKKLQEDFKVYDNLAPDMVSWFRITGLSDVPKITRICKECGIERFDIKNLFSGERITKTVAYPEISFLLLSGCFTDEEKNLHTEQIAFILGKNFVISLQESPNHYFDEIATILQNPQNQLRSRGADYLLCILLNSIQNRLVESIYNEIELLSEVEDSLIDKQDSEINIMSCIRDARGNYLVFRRITSPLREEFANLLHNTNGLISDDNIMYFNDFDDKLRATMNDLEVYGDVLKSILEIYYNNNNQRMNEIIKRLTIVSTIFIPLTFIVGVWGMNFKFMPEIEWKYGYLLAWLTIFFITILSIWLLKKKKWF